MEIFLFIIIQVLLGTQTSEAACPEDIPELTKWTESTTVIVIINLINIHPIYHKIRREISKGSISKFIVGIVCRWNSTNK